MAGFPRVLLSVHRAWEERREEIRQSAAEMTEQLQAYGSLPKGSGDARDRPARQRGQRSSSATSTRRTAGSAGRPSSHIPMDLKVLLRHHARTGDAHALHAVRHTLDKMARGGIYDHLGGGFARYSTDERWLVPHFEKMLYDNALLASAYLEAYQATRDDEFGRVARETMDYVLGRMTDPDGAFYSTEDADSEGVEGKYLRLDARRDQRGPGRRIGRRRSPTSTTSPPSGNWEHQNILNLPKTIAQSARMLGRDEEELRAELAEDRARLLAVRDRRVPPGKDTKVLVSWNGLMIAALAEGGRILREPRYLEAAGRAAGFILDRMRLDDGRLLHTYKDGRARLDAYLDDYANLIDGLTRLYEATGEPRWIESALELARVLLDEFGDPAHGGFFYTGHHHEALIARQKDFTDNATPSGNGMAATALLRLGALTGRDDLTQAGRSALESVQLLLEREPAAAGQSLIALDFLLGPTREFAVIAGSDSS